MYDKNAPHAVELEAGQTTYICQCGLTGNAPFCDGSHKQTADKAPLAYTADKAETLYVCGCGKSKNLPFCDGSHQQ